MSESPRPSSRMPGGALLEELAHRVRALAEGGPARDVQRNLQAVLASALQRMDLVTREEFDAQAALLARTRERLEALQARVEVLERVSAGAGAAGAPPVAADARGG